VHPIGGDHSPAIALGYHACPDLMNVDVADGFRPLSPSVATATDIAVFLKTEPDIPGIDLIEQGIDDLPGAGRSVDRQRPLPSTHGRNDDDREQIIYMVKMMVGDKYRADLAQIHPCVQQLVDGPSASIKQQQIRTNLHQHR